MSYNDRHMNCEWCGAPCSKSKPMVDELARLRGLAETLGEMALASHMGSDVASRAKARTICELIDRIDG